MHPTDAASRQVRQPQTPVLRPKSRAPGYARGRPATIGTEAPVQQDRRESGTPPYWQPGDEIWWRYRRPGWQPGDSQHVQPMRVIQDDADGLVAWLAPGTPCLNAVLAANGGDLRSAGLHQQFRAPRAQGMRRWKGRGILRVAPTGQPWSAWVFWNDDWSLQNWYVNLETPHQRDARNVYTSDHVLDLVVSPDGTVTRKDEDELAEAVAAGRYDRAEAEEFHRVADQVTELVKRGEAPFSDGWEHWRPEPDWPLPALPDGIEARYVDLSY